ncbi:MAG TPA: SDR family NAD(P)-dependent oxidoreductase [Acidimicrobiia bacterium]|nr:SDR family NAD(P)-dependent oxidoreductase [Acidimicrobiia bacterium]
MELDTAVALVTGGASGIGAATTAQLRDAGARVAVLDVQAQDGDGDLAVKCDVGDESQVIESMQRVVDELGPPSAAVLAAGIGGMSPILQMSAEEWDRVQRVNLRGVFLCLREAARAMVAAGQPGAIVAVGSVSGIVSDRGIVHYSTTKAAVHQLARVAAAEMGPQGIRVNAIAPGCTDTPMFAVTEQLPGYQDMVSERAALGRIGTAEEVAAAIVALLRLDWVTGHVLVADGGITLRSPLDPELFESG